MKSRANRQRIQRLLELKDIAQESELSFAKLNRAVGGEETISLNSNINFTTNVDPSKFVNKKRV